MGKIIYDTVVLDGIDKTGKDLICKYVARLSKMKYLCYARGLMSMIAYSDIYGRMYEYAPEHQNGILNVLLTVDYEDWQIRCKITNEPVVNFYRDQDAFMKARKQMIDAGLKVPVINTSNYSPYKAAQKIVAMLDKLNGGCDVNNDRKETN